MRVVTFVALVAMLFISGCAKWEAKNAVKEFLNDPGSAQFSGLVDGAAPGNVCGYLNAKNRMGGYVGKTPFFYEKKTGIAAIVSEVRDADFKRVYDLIVLQGDFSDDLSKVGDKCELIEDWPKVCGFEYPGSISKFCPNARAGVKLYYEMVEAFGR